MIEGSDAEDEWVTHQLAGHAHREEVLMWDEELHMGWPAELRCKDCAAVRYLQRNEAVSKIAAQNLFKSATTYPNGYNDRAEHWSIRG